jgi:N utilization substance protein B
VTESDDETSGGRHAGREVALQVLYALDLGETGPRDARAARAAREVGGLAPPAGPRDPLSAPSVSSSESVPRDDTAERSETVSPSRAAALARATSRSGALIAPRRSPRREPEPPSGPAALRSEKERVEKAEAEESEEESTIETDPVEASAAAFDRIAENFTVPGAAIVFARALVVGVAARASELDELVGQHARNWRVSRMAAVDRNVLRLAVYELRDTETPVAVVIDEAVDLARRFGSDTSPSFVNGILDAVAREVRVA